MTYSQSFIDNHRDFNVGHDWWDAVYDDFYRICEIMGISIDRNEPSFSGFWSQGDGASWAGSYRAIKFFGARREPTYDTAPVKIREYAPKDEELHRIADELCMLARIYRPAYISIGRNSRQSVHSSTMTMDTLELCVDGEWYDAYTDGSGIAEEVADHIGKALLDLLRDLADWLYGALDKEYEYLTSDEAVIESLEANEIEEDA